MIYQSAEFKPYSCDAFVAVALLLLASRYAGSSFRLRYAFLTTIAGAVAVWFSFPSVFVLAALMFAILPKALRKWNEDRRWFAVMVVWGISWGASFLAHHQLWITRHASNQELHQYWASAFMPPPWTLQGIEWLFLLPGEILAVPVGFLIYPGAAVGFLIAGIFLFLRDRSLIRTAAIASVAILLVVSALQLYPLSGRLALFAVPVIALLIAEGADRLLQSTKKHSTFAAWAVISVAAMPLLCGTAAQVGQPHKEEMRSVFDYLAENYKAGDTVHVYYGAAAAFRYYLQRKSIDGIPYAAGENHRAEPDLYTEDLEELQGSERVWIIFSHVVRADTGVDEKALYLQWLDEHGSRLDAFEAPGASIYLYNLGPVP